MSITTLESFLQGSIVTVTNVFATAFTPVVAGRYSVSWTRLSYAIGSAYSGNAEIIYDGSAAYIISSTVGANTAIQLSSGAVQLKQTSGSGQTIAWVYSFTPFA
jgi:hypothetical protein